MNLIAIVDQKWGIAKGGSQICTIPEDLRRFKELTTGSVVIMGRKTYEAIGHALPGRRNIVLSRDTTFFPSDAEVYGDIDYMMYVLAETSYDTEKFVIGGEAIYHQLLSYCDRAYITRTPKDLGADQFFPDLDRDRDWRLKKSEGLIKRDGILYQFRTYERR